MKTDLKEFLYIIKQVKREKYFNASRRFRHHGGDSTVYRHSIRCAYCAYQIAKFFKLRKNKLESTVIAALLHDSYGYDRVANHVGIRSSLRDNKGIEKLTKIHAFYHGTEAVNFVSEYYRLNKAQRDAIIKHMFPLYPIPPCYVEGWIVTLADKIVASRECTITAIDFLHKKVFSGKISQFNTKYCLDI